MTNHTGISDKDVSIDELRQAVEQLHGVPARFVEAVEVHEKRPDAPHGLGKSGTQSARARSTRMQRRRGDGLGRRRRDVWAREALLSASRSA